MNDQLTKIIPIIKERKTKDGKAYDDQVGKMLVYASRRTMVVIPAIGGFFRVQTEKTWMPGAQPESLAPVSPPQNAPFDTDSPF